MPRDPTVPGLQSGAPLTIRKRSNNPHVLPECPVRAGRAGCCGIGALDVPAPRSVRPGLSQAAQNSRARGWRPISATDTGDRENPASAPRFSGSARPPAAKRQAAGPAPAAAQGRYLSASRTLTARSQQGTARHPRHDEHHPAAAPAMESRRCVALWAWRPAALSCSGASFGRFHPHRHLRVTPIPGSRP